MPSSVRFLYRHLLAQGRLVDLGLPASGRLDPFLKEVQAMIARGDPAWEALVPREVATVIKTQGRLGRAEGTSGIWAHIAARVG